MVFHADDITMRGGAQMLSLLEDEALASPHADAEPSPGASPNASEQSTLMVISCLHIRPLLLTRLVVLLHESTLPAVCTLQVLADGLSCMTLFES